MQAATENSDDHDVDPADVGQPIQPPVTVTRLADAARVVGFAGTPYAATRRWVRRLTGRACWRTTGSPTASRHPGRFFLIATEHDTPKRARAYLIPERGRRRHALHPCLGLLRISRGIPAPDTPSPNGRGRCAASAEPAWPGGAGHAIAVVPLVASPTPSLRDQHR